MDVVEAAARERAQEGGADYWTTDLDRILADPNIDAVMVFATHNTHAEPVSYTHLTLPTILLV